MKKILLLLGLMLFNIESQGFAMSLSLESPAFSSNTLIPSQYTCEGADSSPPLVWQDTSVETRSYVLIVDDPDAPGGVWDHWILFNIPSDIKQIDGRDSNTRRGCEC